MGVWDAAKKLNKEFKNDNFCVRGDLISKVEKIPTGALGMDYPLYGGFPYGRILIFSGLPHSGKTTAACCLLAAYQKAHPDKTCVYVDAEHRLDTEFQESMNGVDWSQVMNLNIPTGMSGEQVLDAIIEVEKEPDVGLIVLDSIPALIPEAVLKADMTEDPGMRATMAKKLYPFSSIMQTMLAERGNILVIINQVRDGGMVNGIQIYKEPCGLALQFAPTVTVRFGKRTFTQGDNMKACASTNGEDSDGFRLQFKIIKNSVANPSRGGGFITYRFATGMDSLHDLLEIAEGFDFIKKAGSWRTLVNCENGEVYLDKDGNPLKGYMSDLRKYIQDNPDFRDEYVAMLQRHISNNKKTYGSLLSKEDSAAIDAEENAVNAAIEAEKKKNNGNSNIK